MLQSKTLKIWLSIIWVFSLICFAPTSGMSADLTDKNARAQYLDDLANRLEKILNEKDIHPNGYTRTEKGIFLLMRLDSMPPIDMSKIHSQKDVDNQMSALDPIKLLKEKLGPDYKIYYYSTDPRIGNGIMVESLELAKLNIQTVK
jgi:hypothetical protein